MLNVARVFLGTPAAAALGRFIRLAMDTSRSTRVHLSQGLLHLDDSAEMWEEPATLMVDEGAATCNPADTAIQLTAAATPCIGVYLTARDANTGICIFGDSTITTAGAAIPESTWDKPVFVPIDDVSKIWVASSVLNDVVHWTAIGRPS